MRSRDDGGQVEEHALAILDALEEGVLVVDRGGTVIAANSGFCQMVGLAREQVIGASAPWQWWPEDERDERLARLRAELGGDFSGYHQHQVVFRHGDGHLILADGRLRVIGDNSGQMLLSYREVTDEALRDQRTARLVETTSDALVRVAPDGTLLFVSTGAAAFAGVPPEEVAGSSMIRFLHPDDLEVVGQAFERALAGEVSTVDYRFISATGEMYWLEGTSAPIMGLDGSVVEVQVLSRDITDRVLADMINRAVLEVTGTEARGGSRADVEGALAERTAALTSASAVHVFRVADGAVQLAAAWPADADGSGDVALARRAAHAGSVVRDTVPGGAPALAVGVQVALGAAGAIVLRGACTLRCAEVLGQFAQRVGLALAAAEAHDQLRVLAHTDPLTGLLNRRAFATATDDAITTVRTGANIALAVIDLDGLKDVNDLGGHAAGDRALVHISRCMRTVARSGDAIGRLGGDEFAWLIHGADLEAARRATDRLREAIAHADPSIDGVSASVGVTIIRAADDADALMRRADDLLYAAKTAGRDRTEASA